jgi:glycosyltransferase involved in cell wall biosynthesis
MQIQVNIEIYLKVTVLMPVYNAAAYIKESYR